MGSRHRARPDHALIRNRRRRGVAAVETVLVAPLLLVCVWLLFFFGGGMLHKQQNIVTTRSGAWTHTRNFSEAPHTHNPILEPPYGDHWTWVGHSEVDRGVTIRHHLRASSNPRVTHDDLETAGGVNRLFTSIRGNSAFADQSRALLTAAIPPTYHTETWSLTTDFATGMTGPLGRNINRTIRTDFRMDGGCWTGSATSYVTMLRASPVALFEDGVVNLAVQGLLDLGVSQRDADRIGHLSVLK